MIAPPQTGYPIRRSIAARAGVSALNLLGPGVGLLRVGQLRLALAIAGANAALFLLFGIIFNSLPVLSFGMLVAFTFTCLGAGCAVLFGAIGLTWHHSKQRGQLARWSRWFAIVGAILLSAFVAKPPLLFINHAYKQYYAAAESMMPTFSKNDLMIADMRWRAAEVGGIVLVRAPKGEVRIYRIAAVGGQSFAMRDGVPIVDGRPAEQRPGSTIKLAIAGFPAQNAQRITERFPAERATHVILKTGPQPFDDVAPIRIPAGQMMVLGDNRDMAADGRIPLTLGGVGLLPTSAIVGRPLYISWRGSRPFGQRADH